MKNRFFLLAAACLVCAFLPSPRLANAAEGPGFDSPEEAVKEYLEGLKHADMERMLAACAIETLVDRRDLALTLKRVKYYPAFNNHAPSANHFLRAINIEIREGELAKAIFHQYAALLIPKASLNDKPVIFKNETDAEKFANLFGGEEQLDGLSSLSVLGAANATEWDFVSFVYDNKQNVTNMSRTLQLNGADAFEDIVALFKIGERNFAFLPTVCRYGDKWFITEPRGHTCQFLGMPVASGGMLDLETVQPKAMIPKNR